ncbi:MAG: hypothetical protein KDN19_11385 [Verrucomicrobiae bacterium]|nr:hypothetical protein [Verrucomicrobiae bacterium]
MKHTLDRSRYPSGAPRVTTALSCLGLGFVAALLAFTPSIHAESSGGGEAGTGPIGLAQREATRRQEQIRNAQEVLTDAELDRREGNYADAVEKYRTAFLSLPDIPAAMALRDSIFKRYQQASVEYSEQLITEAKWDQAEAVLVQVMTDARDSGYPPAAVSAELKKLLSRLRSDFYNKAMSPEHLANVDKVEELLTLAKGYVDIGDLTKAKRSYQSVLSIDRTNSAARRGLEMVDGMITEYAEVARNQTRAEMLRKVSESWEMEVPSLADPSGLEVTVESVGERQALQKEKLDRLVLPNVEFVSTPLQTVIDYLTQVARELDASEPDPAKRGINIVVDAQSTTQGATILQKPITLQLSNAPLSAVLQYVTQQAGMKYRIDDFAVTIVPLSSADDKALITRTYVVPPDFISGQASQGGGGGPVDPFAAPAAEGTGSVLKRISAQEFLANSGVSFPPGSLANFNPVNSSLLVRNTPDNIALIEDMIQNAKAGGSKLVQIEFKLIETTDQILNELGFDWLLGQMNAPGSSSIFTSGGTLGNTANTFSATDYPFRDPLGIPVGTYPVTAGLRSGDIKSGFSVDDAINRDSPTPAGSSAAPGVLSVIGAFTDPQFQMVFRGLAQNKGVDVLTASSVLTRAGERAVIRQIREFIYPTEYDPPEIPNSVGVVGNLNVGFEGIAPVTPANPAAFETRELGKVLEVEPTVGADNLTVELNLTVDRSEFSGFVNYGSPITQIQRGDPFGLFAFFGLPAPPDYQVTVTENRILMPVFDSVKENTNLSVYDGQTLVVGGLLGETVTKGEDKIPLLGDAPVMGKFFRSEIKERFRRTMLLFIKVRILDPGGNPINDLGKPEALVSE